MGIFLKNIWDVLCFIVVGAVLKVVNKISLNIIPFFKLQWSNSAASKRFIKYGIIFVFR